MPIKNSKQMQIYSSVTWPSSKGLVTKLELFLYAHNPLGKLPVSKLITVFT